MKEFWDDRFASDDYIYGKDPNPQFKRFINSNKPGKILLPGEGEGRNAVYAAEKGWQVVAVDQSEEGRKKAMMLAREKNVSIKYEICDVMKLEYSMNSFDAICLVFFHLPDSVRKNIHTYLYTLLKPNSKLWILGFSKDQLLYNSGGPKNIDMLYSNDILNEDFSELQIVVNKKYSEHLNEGKGHKGEASLIEFEALKK